MNTCLNGDEHMKKTFRVEVEKESLIFSAAHFITFGDNICESIHGHNYRIACTVEGELDPHACVIDFIWLVDRLKEIAEKLDHHVLLPDRHPKIQVQESGEEVEVRFEQRRWVFPKQDVAILPMDNTTAERLAEFVAKQLMTNREMQAVSRLAVGIDENEGQWAWCELASK